MGLTGLIVRAVIQLKQVASARVRVDTVRTADIDETMAVLAEHDTSFGYTVAWSDSLARGARLGRSVVTSGDFAEPADLPAADRADPFAFRPGARLAVPPWMPPGLINRYSVALANEAYYRRAPRSRPGELQTIGAFFHPLDAIRNWNRVYGHGGFRQYQYVVPFGQEAAVRRSFELVSRARAASFVTVLKRFGAGDPGLLSFPAPGWTPCWPRSTGSSSTRAAGSTWPRTRGCRPARWRRCTRGSRSSASCGPGSTRTGCSPRTCPAGCGCDPDRQPGRVAAGALVSAGTSSCPGGRRGRDLSGRAQHGGHPAARRPGVAARRARPAARHRARLLCYGRSRARPGRPVAARAAGRDPLPQLLGRAAGPGRAGRVREPPHLPADRGRPHPAPARIHPRALLRRRGHRRGGRARVRRHPARPSPG